MFPKTRFLKDKSAPQMLCDWLVREVHSRCDQCAGRFAETRLTPEFTSIASVHQGFRFLRNLVPVATTHVRTHPLPHTEATPLTLSPGLGKSPSCVWVGLWCTFPGKESGSVGPPCPAPVTVFPRPTCVPCCGTQASRSWSCLPRTHPETRTSLDVLQGAGGVRLDGSWAVP